LVLASLHATPAASPDTRTAAVVVRVALCASVRLYRGGLALSLAHVDGIAVAASVGDSTPAAVAELRAAKPVVVVVDATGDDGPNAIRRIIEGVPGAAVVALAIPETDDVVIACAEAGIGDYTPRVSTLEELVATIRRA